MRIVILTVALLAAFSTGAEAATITVRIEGQSRTLFEGPITTNGRNVQALSERASGALRRCDGTNNSAGRTIVPTGTSSTADALALLGQGFDGDWYEEYKDYLVDRLGDERGSWKLYKNDAFSAVGGCQMRLNDGERVLWANQQGQTVQPITQNGSVVSSPGATIYEAAADGTVAQTLSATGSYDLAALPGGRWYRIKADRAGYVRSPRIDWCTSACPAKPADMSVRVPPTPVFYGPGGTPLSSTQSRTLATELSPLRVTRPVTGRSAYRRGRIAVRWRIVQQGTGLLRWAIASDDLSTTAKRYSTRARGTTQTSAAVALPAGRVHALRFTSTDRLGRNDAIDFGRVLVPIDDRAVRRSGSWRKARSSKAWKGTLLRGGRGARASVRLAAGRPALVLGGKGRALVRIGSKTVRVRGGRTAFGPKRRKAGRVTITVIRGSISLDGVAASP